MNDQINNDGESKQAENRNDGGGIKRDHSTMTREQQLERELAAAQQELAAKNQQLAAKDQIENGTYFALIDDVFQGAIRKTQPNLDSDFKSACRGLSSDDDADRSFRTGNEHRRQYFDYYKHTKQKAASANSAGAADDVDQSRRSYSDSNNSTSALEKKAKKIDRIWPKGIFGQKSLGGHIAHLIPASPDKANTFWFITDFLFGYNETHRTDWETRKKLIHGVNQWVDDKKGGRKKEKSRRYRHQARYSELYSAPIARCAF